PHPQHAAAAKLGLAMIDLALALKNSLVANRHIEKSIHGEADVGRNVIVKSALRWIGIGRLNQLRAILADAMIIDKYAELRHVMHIELAIDILHAIHRVQAFGKDGLMPIGKNAEN